MKDKKVVLNKATIVITTAEKSYIAAAAADLNWGPFAKAQLGPEIKSDVTIFSFSFSCQIFGYI